MFVCTSPPVCVCISYSLFLSPFVTMVFSLSHFALLASSSTVLAQYNSNTRNFYNATFDHREWTAQIKKAKSRKQFTTEPIELKIWTNCDLNKGIPVDELFPKFAHQKTYNSCDGRVSMDNINQKNHMNNINHKH